MIKIIRALIRPFGIDLVRYTSGTPDECRNQIMKSSKIDLLFDVGANTGQFASEIRSAGYSGKIFSFEPLSNEFNSLSEKSKKDPLWDVFNFAFGAKIEETKINISENSQSSSLLTIKKEHTLAAPKSSYVGKETIEVKTLDAFWKEMDASCDRPSIMLKIDVQGFEDRVLKGGKSYFLPKVKLIQIEMSLVELYEGQMLFFELAKYLVNLGFNDLVFLRPGFKNKTTGRLLQCDGIFMRANLK
ncbi:MAG: FkbM family methyltransferase [Proteobacteria bacterium]|nr:FkbM family methyltransferase [Pseudomonadota bacterium]